MRPDPVSDWTLERIALGELVGDELVRAHARLAAETGGVQRLRALEESTAQILRTYPAEVMVPAIEARIARQEARDARGSFRRGWWSGLAVGLTAAAAALVFALVAPTAPLPGDGRADQATRLKGLQPHLVVHRAAGDRSERLRPGDRVAPGDVLQVGYVAGGEPYGAIVSIDGAGAVTLHHPEFATLPPALAGKGRVDLPFSYELDDAPGFERFVFVTSPEPLDVDGVLKAARAVAAGDAPRTASLPLPDGLHQDSLVLDKRGSR